MGGWTRTRRVWDVVDSGGLVSFLIRSLKDVFGFSNEEGILSWIFGASS